MVKVIAIVVIYFGNGTFQGAAHGLARLLVNDLGDFWKTIYQVVSF